jgi:hypothetical protein
MLDDFGRKAVAAIADLGHYRWLRLKPMNGKRAYDVTMPLERVNALKVSLPRTCPMNLSTGA